MNPSIQLRTTASGCHRSLKSNLVIKPPIFLAALLTAASLLVPFARAAEPPILMPTGRGGGQPDNGIQPFDPNPAGRGSITRKFMTYGEDSDGNTVPTKTLRITNNTADTVYPIMRAENSNQLRSNPAVGLYDPYDPPDKEYRGYIGYKQGDKYYFGLKKGESILVSLPLVLWNGSAHRHRHRRQVPHSQTRRTPKSSTIQLQRAALHHQGQSRQRHRRRYVVSGRTKRGLPPMIPRISSRSGPFATTSTWLIRRSRAKTNGEIPDNQLVTLINYDVSNVDNLYLPLAMAANDVWVRAARGTGRQPQRLEARVGSRCLWLDRRRQHDRLSPNPPPGIHRRQQSAPREVF